MLADDGLKYVRNALALEYAAIGGSGEKPKPRPHRGLVAVMALLIAGLRELGDVAIEVAVGGVVGQLEHHGDRLSQNLVGIDIFLRR